MADDRWTRIPPASDRTRPKSLNGLGAPEVPRLQLPPRLGLPERRPGAETCQLPSVVTAAAAAESPWVSPERSGRWFLRSAVQPCVLNPPKMRPKRYLRDEYKQLGHGCHPNHQVWTEFLVDWVRFGRPIVTWSCPLPESFGLSPLARRRRSPPQHRRLSQRCCLSPQVP
jgi:hypothetical protein